MELLQKIKRQQIRRKEKRPYRHSAFAVVSTIVHKYELRDEFLLKLAAEPVPPGNGFIYGPLKSKKKLDLLPFVLSDKTNYNLTRKILDSANNRYLPYARSPDEIVISQRLFVLNPFITPVLLQSRHFETLYLVEIARKRIHALSAQMEQVTRAERNSKAARSGSASEPEHGSAETTRLQIKALNEFIFFVENPDGMENER